MIEKKSGLIVEIEGVYLRETDGMPDLTSDIFKAKVFDSKKDAEDLMKELYIDWDEYDPPKFREITLTIEGR